MQIEVRECWISFGADSFVFESIKNLKNKIYRTIILPVVVYGCETWSLTLREQRRLKLFENIWASEGRGKMGVDKTR